MNELPTFVRLLIMLVSIAIPVVAIGELSRAAWRAIRPKLLKYAFLRTNRGAWYWLVALTASEEEWRRLEIGLQSLCFARPASD